MCRVMKNKEKLIFWNEAAKSSQVKVVRTVSGDKLAITLLWPYQPVCILLFDSLLSLMTEQLITLTLSLENIILFAYVRNSESL